MRRRIFFVINSLAGGGAERVMTTLLAASEDRLVDTDIVLILLDRDKAAYAAPPWLAVRQLNSRQSLVRSVLCLWKATSGVEAPDLAFSFLTRANVATAIVMVLRRKPFIISERVNTSAHFGNGIKASLGRFLVRVSYPFARRVIAVSQGVADTLISDFGIERNKVTAIDNPIDLGRISHLGEEPPELTLLGSYIVAMGRLVPNKNFGLAIRAFACSQVAGSLVILGEGPERSSLYALASELGVADRLIMPGFVNNPYALIAKSRFLVSSSNAEGFPNAVVEAMALGVPVVATDCPSGSAEVLDASLTEASTEPVAGKGGFLVSADSVYSMQSAFRKLEDPSLRRVLAEAGKRRADQFGLSSGVNKYWRVINEALDC